MRGVRYVILVLVTVCRSRMVAPSQTRSFIFHSRSGNSGTVSILTGQEARYLSNSHMEGVHWISWICISSGRRTPVGTEGSTSHMDEAHWIF